MSDLVREELFLMLVTRLVYTWIAGHGTTYCTELLNMLAKTCLLVVRYRVEVEGELGK